jgi:hypothetical protein
MAPQILTTLRRKQAKIENAIAAYEKKAEEAAWREDNRGVSQRRTGEAACGLCDGAQPLVGFHRILATALATSPV